MTERSLNDNLRRTGGSLASPAGTLTPVGESLAGSSFCGSEVHTLPQKFIHIQIWTWAISFFCTFLQEEVTIASQYKSSHFLEIPTIKMGFCKFGYCSCPFSQHYLHQQPDNGDDDDDEGGRVDPAGQLPLRRRRISFSGRRISRAQASPRSRSHQV